MFMLNVLSYTHKGKKVRIEEKSVEAIEGLVSTSHGSFIAKKKGLKVLLVADPSVIENASLDNTHENFPTKSESDDYLFVMQSENDDIDGLLKITGDFLLVGVDAETGKFVTLPYQLMGTLLTQFSGLDGDSDFHPSLWLHHEDIDLAISVKNGVVEEK